jgi:1,4-dihydroxy-2-naphthoate polyprenyltransferase
MYGMGVASGDRVSVGTYLLGQLMVTSAQVTAHYVNEYADVEADRLVTNRTFFSGGSGVLVSGATSPRVALRSAITTSAITVIAAVAIASISPIAALLGLVALAVSWAYSMPPVRLLNTGWGEMLTSLVVVGVVPLIGVFMTDARPGPGLWRAMTILIPVHIAMMLVFEIPDAMTDRRAGKTVLAVRLGEPRTIGVIAGLYLLSALVTLTLGARGGVGGAWAPLAVGIAIGGVLLSLRWRRFALATALAVLVFVILGSLILAGFLA